ncbi:MAG: phosphotransferase [Candidatus Obscuribacterales bacterium]|nr:phosphotransferase [Steroidobacteraceae bacterium]
MQLTEWTRTTLGRSDVTIEVASADASFRRYFRARSGAETWIVMDAPPEKEDVGPYIKVAEILRASNLNAPRVVARNLESGYLLLSDLGGQTYLTQLRDADTQQIERLYEDALAALLQMQVACTAHVQLSSDTPPAYDAALLQREMELFPEWFLQRHLGLAIDDSLQQELNCVFRLLSDSALEQPRVFVHRDFHSRNLMVTAGRYGTNPGVLDFQDAVMGPITYDLVSLLRDCYIDWPLASVRAWALGHRQRALAVGLTAAVPEAQWLVWFDLMGIQRHLKAIGIFARLWHRDDKPGYLGDIPRTLGYIRSVATLYPQLKPLAELIELRVVPALSQLQVAT